MSQVWQCDRCEAISKNGNVDDPPDGWKTYEMPVRGSEGARSTMNYTLCGDCEDSLYAWLHKDRGSMSTDGEGRHGNTE